MKKTVQPIAALLLFVLLFSSCKKDEDTVPANSINNTSWQVTLTANGSSSTQHIFEFAGNGTSFSWHPAAAASYTGTWSQKDDTINFTFKESTTSGDYYWDNTGTLSNSNTILTGTMQRRGVTGSATFTARKL